MGTAINISYKSSDDSALKIPENIKNDIATLSSLCDKVDDIKNGIYEEIISSTERDLSEEEKKNLRSDIDFYIIINDDTKGFINKIGELF